MRWKSPIESAYGKNKILVLCGLYINPFRNFKIRKGRLHSGRVKNAGTM